MEINFKVLTDGAKEPTYGSKFSAGADLYACIDDDIPSIILDPSEIVIIPTGIACEIPDGFFGMVCSRSGLAARYGVVVLNSPGIIDSDYRGEIKLIMTNHSNTPFVIENGMRLAQLIIVPFEKGIWIQKEELSHSERGPRGIGSTGLN